MRVGENQKCTIQSSGSITVDAPATNNRAVILRAGSTLVNRGTITAESAPNPGNPGSFLTSNAFRIIGAGSKVINYGNIYLPEEVSRGFETTSGVNNVVIEFLSGSLIADSARGGYRFLLVGGANTKLTFGGTALIAPENSQFFRNIKNTDSVIILLPGATIHTGNRLRPLAGLLSILSGGDDELKIGNFYDGDEPVGARTGWVHAGQWRFGGGTDELIIDTSPGVRFSNRGGINHNRGTIYTDNAIHDLETMRIRSGNVVLGSSVYMPNGKVYIHDAGRLTFEIGKRREEDSRKGEMIISRLRANQLIFTDEDPRVFIQFAHYLTNNEIEKFRKQLVASELRKHDARTFAYAADDSPVSQILKLTNFREGVFFAGTANYRQLSDWLKVFSQGPGGVQKVGRIWLADGVGGVTGAGPDGTQGLFRLNQDEVENAGKIGKLQFSTTSTRSTATTGGTDDGTGTGGTDDGTDTDGTDDGTDTDGTDDGTGTGGTDDGTGTGGTDDGTGTDDTGTGDTGTGSAGTGGGSGGGGGGGGILVIGLLAALMGGVDLDESESELGQYYAFDRRSAKNRSRSSSYFSGLFRSERGMWVRPAESRFTSFGASYFGAVSHRMSWDLQQSGDYFLRASLSPATSVSPTGWHSSASGETLTLSGGWQGEGQRLQLGFTHGRYDANAKFFDSATKGNLFGESKFRHTSVHASAVQELSDGPMKVSASASLMAGQVEQAAYDAENAVMRAKVPAYRQSYTGTRLGFSAKSRKWFSLSDAVSVKPHLKVTSMRTRASVNDPVWLRQSDKVGALSFENATVLQGVPKSLNVVGIGTDVKPSDSRGVWRLGYAGMEVDGEYQHAAVAAYQMRF